MEKKYEKRTTKTHDLVNDIEERGGWRLTTGMNMITEAEHLDRKDDFGTENLNEIFLIENIYPHVDNYNKHRN